MKRSCTGNLSKRSGTHAKRRFLPAAFALCGMAFLLCAALQSDAAMSPDDFVRLRASAGPDAIRGAPDKGADPNAVWTGPNKVFKTGSLIYQGDSALAACLRNRADLVGLLLHAGADPKASVILAHHDAAGDPEVFALVMRAGADLRSTDKQGKTVLRYAARNVRPELVQSLLAAGFDPNAEYPEGGTPLHEQLRSAEVVASLAKAGADVNRENKKGPAPFEEVREQAIPDALPDAGARLIWLDAQGRARVRGFSPDGAINAICIRFFMATATGDSTSTGRMNPLQKALLASLPLEKPRRADPDGAEKYSEMVRFVSQDDGTPIANYVYYIESHKGAAVFGRTDKNGCTARVYTPGPEELQWSSGEDAVASLNALTVSGRANVLFEPPGSPDATRVASPEPENGGRSVRRGDRSCFVHPDNRLPVAGYPYFILTESGYAIAGETGDDGCSADFFAPLGEGEAEEFSVYGGPDAARMNVKGRQNP
jgi:ankyrin repeat protein